DDDALAGGETIRLLHMKSFLDVVPGKVVANEPTGHGAWIWIRSRTRTGCIAAPPGEVHDAAAHAGAQQEQADDGPDAKRDTEADAPLRAIFLALAGLALVILAILFLLLFFLFLPARAPTGRRLRGIAIGRLLLGLGIGGYAFVSIREEAGLVDRLDPF